MATGTYIATSNVQDIFGTTNVAAWSNLDRSTASADDDRIQSAISWAEQYVEDRLRDSIYAIPLTATTGTLTTVIDWCAKLAGYWLYRDRGQDDADKLADRMDDIKTQVDGEITGVLAGTRRLKAKLSDNHPSAPIVHA